MQVVAADVNKKMQRIDSYDFPRQLFRDRLVKCLQHRPFATSLSKQKAPCTRFGPMKRVWRKPKDAIPQLVSQVEDVWFSITQSPYWYRERLISLELFIVRFGWCWLCPLLQSDAVIARFNPAEALVTPVVAKPKPYLDVETVFALKIPQDVKSTPGVHTKKKKRQKYRCRISGCPGDVSVEYVNMRRADEAATPLFACLGCGHTWRHHAKFA